jgi:hypothetical protein
VAHVRSVASAAVIDVIDVIIATADHNQNASLVERSIVCEERPPMSAFGS